MIHSRGYPNFGVLVHMEHPHSSDSNYRMSSGEPLCRNGAWNLKYTREKSRVTCQACLKLMRVKA